MKLVVKIRCFVVMRLIGLAETLWLRFSLREQVIGAARVLEKGVLCWLHGNRGLLLTKPIRMFGERC